MHTFTFATSHALIQKASRNTRVGFHSRLGALLEEVVVLVLHTPFLLTQLALPLLGSTRFAKPRNSTVARLARLLESAILPPGVALMVELNERGGSSNRTANRSHPGRLTGLPPQSRCAFKTSLPN